MNLTIYYPFRPFIITQHWGNPNPLYEKLGFSRHNGVDAFTGRTDWQGKVVSEYPVYCPVEGFVVESVTWEPKGGGNQISLISKNKLSIGGKECYARLFLCHAKQILVKPGYEPALGELIMIADNTGLSTGIHTHMGLYRLNSKKEKIDVNDATGSYNPEPFFTTVYATSMASFATIVLSGQRYIRYLLGA